MAEQQQQQNGYLTASQLLTNTINQCMQSNITLDEIFAALAVQKEVLNVRLAQVIVENNQRQAIEAYKAQQAAAAGQQDLPLEEGSNDAN